MDERIFDVSKPHKVNPGATSKPVIVGHHPEIPDPMIRENAPDKPQIPKQPEFGPPSDGNPLGLPEVPALVPDAEEPLTPPVAQPSEEKPEIPPLLAPEEPVVDKPAPASSDQPPPTAQMFNKATGQTVEPTHASWKPEHELPISGHHHKGGFKKTPLIIVAAIFGFLGLYALLDSGLIVDVDLPLHIFTQDEEPQAATESSQTPPAEDDWVDQPLVFNPGGDIVKQSQKETLQKLTFSAPVGWERSTESENEWVQFLSPDFKGVQFVNGSSVNQGGYISVSAYPTEYETIRQMEEEEAFGYFSPTGYAEINGIEAIKGSCGHFGRAACYAVIHDGYYYELAYRQVDENIKSSTPENKYIKNFNDLIKAVNFSKS